MPLGDSITQADADHPAYRYALWKLLKEGGFNVDFVGSLRNNYGGENPVQSFDHDHEGHWGWRADQILYGVPEKGNLHDFLTVNTPDIVLIHLGTNDIFQGEKTREIMTDLKGIVNVLITANKDITIMIAQIIPVADVRINRQIRLLNDAISSLPSEMKAITPHIVVVNQYQEFDPLTDTYDGIHPNSAGEDKMARNWFHEIKAVLK